MIQPTSISPQSIGVPYPQSSEVHLSREWRRLVAELQALRGRGIEEVHISGLSGTGAMVVTPCVGGKVIEP